MSESVDSCPDCGSEIPHDAPLGMCPTCLVSDAVSNADADADCPKSSLVENHDIVRMVGEGGFARVFEANELEPVRRRVALKILRREISSPRILARFEAERQALALMDHPGIATVYSAGETEDGEPWVSMEFVDGVPVTDFCRNENLNLRERIEIVRNICLAVHHAHLKGVLHRDLKPSNVLAARIDGKIVTKVIDFGIARALDESLTDRTVYTEMYQLVGTPGYMSPEQASFDGHAIDARSDLYSLGVLLYEILAGTPPFPASGRRKKSLLELLQKVKESEPPRLSSHDSTLRGPIEWVTRKAMAKNPDERYESAAALAADLDNFLHSRPVDAGSPPLLYFFRLFVKRHRTAVAGATLGALALAVGLIIASIQYTRAIRLSQDLQKSEVELRESFRDSDFRLAAQMHQRRRAGDAIAYLCRALRTDPEHHASASCLLSILAHNPFRKLQTEPLRYPPNITTLHHSILSQNGNQAVAIGSGKGASEKLIRINFKSGERQIQPTGFDNSVRFLSPLEEGDSFAISDGTRVDLRHVLSPSKTTRSWTSPEEITALHTDPAFRKIAWGTKSGHLHCISLSETWPKDELPEIKSITVGRGEITALLVNPNGSSIAYGTKSGLVGIWNPETDFHQWNAVAHRAPISAIASSPSGSPIATGDSRGMVNTFRIRTMLPLSDPLPHSGAITSLAFHNPTQLLYAGDEQGIGRYWRPNTGELAAADTVLRSPVFFARTIPAGRKLLIAEKGGSVRLSDPTSGLGEALGGAGGTSAVAMNASGNSLFLCNNARRTIFLYDLSRPASVVPRRHFFPPENFPASPVATEELVRRSQATSISLPRENGESILFRQPREIMSAKLSPDQSRFVIVSGGNFVQLWDTSTLEPLTLRFPLPFPVKTTEFTDDDEILQIISEDDEPFLWNLPPKNPQLSPWFLTFCEKVGGKQLKGSQPRTVESRSLVSLQKALPSEQTNTIDQHYARWMMAPPLERDLGPGIPYPTKTYVAELVERSTPASLREALQLAPQNTAAIEAVKSGGLREPGEE